MISKLSESINPRSRILDGPQSEGNPIRVGWEWYVKCLLCETFFLIPMLPINEDCQKLGELIDCHWEESHPGKVIE